MNAITLFETVVHVVMLTVLAWEIQCFGNAVMASLEAPTQFKLATLHSTYLWNSLIFRDAYKAFCKVPNIAINTWSAVVTAGVFLMLGSFELWTPLATLGVAFIGGLAMCGGSHVALRNSKAYKEAEAYQERLQHSA